MKFLGSFLLVYLFLITTVPSGMKLVKAFVSCEDTACCITEGNEESSSDAATGCDDCSFCLICSCCTGITAPAIVNQVETVFSSIQSGTPNFVVIPHPGKFIAEIWQPPKSA